MLEKQEVKYRHLILTIESPEELWSRGKTNRNIQECKKCLSSGNGEANLLLHKNSHLSSKIIVFNRPVDQSH